MQRLLPDLVQRAPEILGDLEHLARHLSVDEHRVRFWKQGTASAPNHVIVALVDIVLKDDIARAYSDRRARLRAIDHGVAEYRSRIEQSPPV